MKSKNIKLFVLLVFYFNIIQAQQIQVLFYDNANYVDTITIGYMPNATLGIDTLLGERNLSSQVNPNWDIRVVQRDSAQFSCTYIFPDTTPIYYRQVFDSKINVRNKNDTSLTNRVFEVLRNRGVPNHMRLKFSKNMSSIIEHIHLFEYCLDPLSTYILPQNTTEMIVNLLSPPSHIVFTFKKEALTNTEIYKNKDNELEIYPNPFNGYFFVKKMNEKILNLKLYNSLGQYFLQQTLNDTNIIQINTDSLNSGLYYAVLTDEFGEIIIIKKLLKL